MMAILLNSHILSCGVTDFSDWLRTDEVFQDLGVLVLNLGQSLIKGVADHPTQT